MNVSNKTKNCTINCVKILLKDKFMRANYSLLLSYALTQPYGFPLSINVSWQVNGNECGNIDDMGVFTDFGAILVSKPVLWVANTASVDTSNITINGPASSTRLLYFRNINIK